MNINDINETFTPSLIFTRHCTNALRFTRTPHGKFSLVIECKSFSSHANVTGRNIYGLSAQSLTYSATEYERCNSLRNFYSTSMSE